ncbi:MAG: hypothetical protein AAF229_07340 [Pseudomonadota bacterium]
MNTLNYRSAVALCAGLILAAATLPASAHDLEHANAHDAAHHDAHAEPDHARIQSSLTVFRVTGDDTHLDAAWAELEPHLGDPTLLELIDAAVVAQARHDFTLAETLLRDAVARDHDNDEAWLQLASLHLVKGAHEDADYACHQLRHVSLLVAATCHARVDIAKGDGDKAQRQLEAILRGTKRDWADAEILAWTLSVAGDAAASADPDAAVAHYEESLALADRTQVRAALVDVLIAQDRVDDAARVLSNGPEALALSVRKMIIGIPTAHEPDLKSAIAGADQQFRTWIAEEDWAHSREMTRFYLDVLPDTALARRLAGINCSIQSEPEDRLLSARAALLRP